MIIENCGSGGMRMDYALLSRHSIQSITDQTDYKKNSVIAAASPSLVVPEQSAIWSYPSQNGDYEETAFNMINAMLLRIHQSGHLNKFDNDRINLIKEGITYYKKIRSNINQGLPFWPTGTPGFDSEWSSLALQNDKICYIAVWRYNSQKDTFTIPLTEFKGEDVLVQLGYPSSAQASFKWNKERGELSITIPNSYSARLLEIKTP